MHGSIKEATVRGVALQQVAHQGVLVKNARAVELSSFVVSDSRYALRLGTGGEAS